jgi:hypothetical protein
VSRELQAVSDKQLAVGKKEDGLPFRIKREPSPFPSLLFYNLDFLFSEFYYPEDVNY